jgi:hypothetical protein
MAKWQASKADMSPRKNYIPEIELEEITMCRRHYYQGQALPINCVECRAEADQEYRLEQPEKETSDDE